MSDITENDKITDDFERDYWLGQKPEIQALKTLPRTERAIRALQLSQAGFLIDTECHVLGADRGGAWLTHLVRSNYGIPYVGSMEGIGVRGGFDPERPMNVPYPWPATPAGKVPTVYFDPEDPQGTLARLHALYPPPAPKPEPPTTPVIGMVGSWVYGNIYRPGPAANRDNVVDGGEYTQDGKVYVAHESEGLMGWSCYFTPKA